MASQEEARDAPVSTMRALRSPHAGFVAVLSLLFLDGCMCTHMGTEYVIRGRLIDSGAGEPIGGATVAAGYPTSGTTTDENGFFEAGHGAPDKLSVPVLLEFGGLASLLRPVPDPLESVILFCRPSGQQAWQRHTVELTPTQQTKTRPGTRWVDVGTIALRTEGSRTAPPPQRRCSPSVPRLRAEDKRKSSMVSPQSDTRHLRNVPHVAGVGVARL